MANIAQTVNVLQAMILTDGEKMVLTPTYYVNPEASVDLAAQLNGATPKRTNGQILTAATITAHNTFDHPSVVESAPFQAATVTPDGFTTTLPPKSIVLLRFEE